MKWKYWLGAAVLGAAVLAGGCGFGRPPAASALSNQAETGKTGEQAEIENFTRYADYTPEKAVPRGIIPGTHRHILVAYFSRSGNTAAAAGDSSSPGLDVGKDGSTAGNAERMARWIAEETGGDLFTIQTEYTYPVDYRKTVRVGEGQDMDNVHPALAGHIDDVGRYSTIYLVYPTWHYTLPAPVCTFLDEYDLSGKTVYAFNTSAGSRFADTLERIREAEPKARVVEGISLMENETKTKEGEEKVRNFVRNHPSDS